MSLSVYLTLKGANVVKDSSGIFIRENGSTIEISEEEWYKRFPEKQPIKYLVKKEPSDIVYEANITHNLGKMADEAGIYEYLWRPENLDITFAKQLIIPLAEGLGRLLENPEKYKEFNPSNEWGSYEGLVEFVKEYLKACIDYPEAEVSVSR